MRKYFFLCLIACQIIIGMTISAYASKDNEAGAPNSNSQHITCIPENGDVLNEMRPLISVEYNKNSNINYMDSRLWVNGKEVTGQCLISSTFISYQSQSAMEQGTITVRFWSRTSQNAEINEEWSFVLKHPEGITSITHNGQQGLGEFDEFIVEMHGLPGGKATFEADGIFDPQPMQEVSPGVYRSDYKISKYDRARNSKVTCHLTVNGDTYSKTAEETANLMGFMFQIHILEPAEGEEVPLKFKIKGRTRPNCNISIMPQIGMNDNMVSNTRDSKSQALGTIPTRSDENGYFEAEYGFLIKLPNMRALLTITASDEKGNRSIPKTLRVKFK
ncbi:MAG: hypothetical protein K6G50_02205 [bacterium]|nr:hypothetical protein [bacterium]